MVQFENSTVQMVRSQVWTKIFFKLLLTICLITIVVPKIQMWMLTSLWGENCITG